MPSRFAGAITEHPELGVPVRLFSLEPEDLLLDIMKDGRFVVLRRGPRGPSTSVNVITTWFDEVCRQTAQ